jgi:ketosteroid isomerase-like protein
MPQDQAAVIGRDAIRSVYETVLHEYEFNSDGIVKEVVVSDNLGYFWSTYTLTVTPRAGGEPICGTGKSIFIVERNSDGQWKIARLIDNSDGTTTAEIVD